MLHSSIPSGNHVGNIRLKSTACPRKIQKKKRLFSQAARISHKPVEMMSLIFLFQLSLQ